MPRGCANVDMFSGAKQVGAGSPLPSRVEGGGGGREGVGGGGGKTEMRVGEGGKT